MAGFSFGTPPATTTTGTSSFGLGTKPLPFTSGTSANPGGVTFGASNTSTSALSGLGTSNVQSQPGGFTFGTTAQPAATTSSITFGVGSSGGGLNFKGATTTATGTNFTFGATGQVQPTFGAPAFSATVATTTSATGGVSFFSTPASGAQSSTISFGAVPHHTGLVSATPTTTQTILTYNPPASTTTTNKTSLPGTSSLGAAPSVSCTTTVSASGGLSFAFPSAAKTTSSAGFSLSTPSTCGTGIFGFSSGTTTTSGTATTTSAPVFKGLGGVDATKSLTGISGTSGGSGGRSENKTAKENLVPNDILMCIENFKGFVKIQKNLSCEVTRASMKPMAKVTEDTLALQQLLSSLATDVQKNIYSAEYLRAETSKGFSQCEMAQRTHDTPAGLQNDNMAPVEFFMNLAAKFEHNVNVLRQEIDNTEKHVNTLNQPTALTSPELSLALKRLHESFVALAGRLQVVHQTVVAQKERHLSLRRHFLKDATDIFSKTGCDSSKKSGIVAGPTPFSAMGTVQTLGIMVNQDKTISSFSCGGPTMAGWNSPQTGTPVPSLTAGGNLFGSSAPFSSSADNSNFQLLKPPPGNKRGKR